MTDIDSTTRESCKVTVYYNNGDIVEYTDVSDLKEETSGTLRFHGKQGTTGPRGKWTIPNGPGGYRAYVIHDKKKEEKK